MMTKTSMFRQIQTAFLAMLCVLALGMNQAQARGNSPQDALKTIQEGADTIISKLNSNRAALKRNPEGIFPLLDQMSRQYFDFKLIAQGVVGAPWRQATPTQRTQIAEEFRKSLIKTYGKALLSYDGQAINYVSARADVRPNTSLVDTQLTYEGKPVSIRYRMVYSGGSWKVYDVLVEGVSLIANYRTSFADVIKVSGVDGLISRLKSADPTLLKAGEAGFNHK